MAKINLLPWREELRELRKKVFFGIFCGAILLALVTLFIIDRFINSAINTQQIRNQYLNNEITQLEKKIVAIKDIKAKKILLLERMDVIKGLQGNRSVIVQVFDQLARVVPEGIYFKTLKIEGDLISLVGIAESNNRVAALMRQLDASQWFTNPNLTAVRKVNDEGERLNEFDLNFIKVKPNNEGESSL
ncbi:MAG: PilN domain-containing protein [Endozoicomonas sp. (ex Botrylloides leachii)]|nr:PilN domain-containing protein [Endozoicomonas sp. (ex Botrylloides leachii)]